MTQEVVFACDALGDLYRYNAQLLLANKELLARCDLLEAELAALVEAARPVVTACYAADADGELDERIDGDMLFKLTALVGEEGK